MQYFIEQVSFILKILTWDLSCCVKFSRISDVNQNDPTVKCKLPKNLFLFMVTPYQSRLFMNNCKDNQSLKASFLMYFSVFLLKKQKLPFLLDKNLE